MIPIVISPLNIEELKTFFQTFNFSNESKNTRDYISFIQEASFCYQNIIHNIYDSKEEKVVGFVALSTTKDVDSISGVLVEFLYLKPDYRKKTEEISQIRYSYLVLDYVIETAIKIQKEVAINHVYLVPINTKVRSLYVSYGFVNIPNSGNNEYEDYMVFNLLDEDPTIILK